MKWLGTIALAMACAVSTAKAADVPAPDGKAHKITLHDGKFFIDDSPIRVFAGEMHPGRIPAEMWDDRIKKAKAMGLNTISIYLYWNQIEPQEGKFVFEGQTDIRRFAKLCQDNGMWLIVRAGPYVCAEIEFGGFPYWLLNHQNLQIRRNEPDFMACCKQYIDQVGAKLADMQVGHGGPIIMVQFENELGRIDDYLAAVKGQFVAAGFDGQLMTCDPSGRPAWAPWTTINGIPNVLRGYNGFADDDTFDMRYQQALAVGKAQGGYPVYSPEVYTGWFALFGNWPGAKSPKVALDEQVKEINFIMDHKDVSWCLYLFDGGTNFGFISGANGNHPMQTSYDYDAPVDELGRVTAKYRALRDIYAKNTPHDLPPIPADPAIIAIPQFDLHAGGPLLAGVSTKPVAGDNVRSFEELNQSGGFVDYQKKFDNGLHGTLNAGPPRDYVSVMLNGKVIKEAFNTIDQTVTAQIDAAGPCTLDILVHNLGRNSLIQNSNGQRKGLTANPTLNNVPLTGWSIYPLPLNGDDLPTSPPATTASQPPTGPTWYSGTFTLNDLGETYLDMSKWHFGVVWVNGHNLGRYWDVGTSRAIYLPSVWEKKGENQITILELGQSPASPTIAGVKNMIATPATRVQPLWNSN